MHASLGPGLPLGPDWIWAQLKSSHPNHKNNQHRRARQQNNNLWPHVALGFHIVDHQEQQGPKRKYNDDIDDTNNSDIQRHQPQPKDRENHNNRKTVQKQTLHTSNSSSTTKKHNNMQEEEQY